MVTIRFKVPEKMFQTAQRPDIQETPYDLCFECPFRSVTCDGPNEQAMTMPRRITWFNRLGKERGITRAAVAELSGVPLAPINSIMTGRTPDPRHSTMQALSQAYSGGCWGQYPCHMAALLMQGKLTGEDDDPEADELRGRLHRAEDELRQRSYVAESDHRAVVFLKEQIAFLDAQIKEKDSSIRRKEKLIVKLFIALALLLFFIIVVLAYDMLRPDIGFIRAAMMRGA